MKKTISLLLTMFFTLATIFVFTSCQSKPSPLTEIEKIVGKPSEDILSDDTYKVSNSIGDIKIVRKTTNDVFGIVGEITIFILSDEKYIDIVTWQSTNKSPLTEKEIKTFVDGMKEIYGKPIDSSKNNYMWQNDELGINLKIDENEVYLTFVNNQE